MVKVINFNFMKVRENLVTFGAEYLGKTFTGKKLVQGKKMINLIEDK